MHCRRSGAILDNRFVFAPAGHRMRIGGRARLGEQETGLDRVDIDQRHLRPLPKEQMTIASN